MNDAREKKLQAFVAAMRTQFEANDVRGGWRSRDLPDQIKYLDELQELVIKLANSICGGSHRPGEEPLGLLEQQAEILAKAADVANLSLILADNAGAIKEK
jgi:hypothetical protein